MSYADDVVQIEQIVAHYCHYADSHRVDDWLTLFSDDIWFEASGVVVAEGKDALRSWITRSWDVRRAQCSAVRHRVTSGMVDVRGAEAECHANFDADMLYGRDGEFRGLAVQAGDLIQYVGRYDLDLLSDGTRWAIKRLRLVGMWINKQRPAAVVVHASPASA